MGGDVRASKELGALQRIVNAAVIAMRHVPRTTRTTRSRASSRVCAGVRPCARLPESECLAVSLRLRGTRDPEGRFAEYHWVGRAPQSEYCRRGADWTGGPLRPSSPPRWGIGVDGTGPRVDPDDARVESLRGHRARMTVRS